MLWFVLWIVGYVEWFMVCSLGLDWFMFRCSHVVLFGSWFFDLGVLGITGWGLVLWCVMSCFDFWVVVFGVLSLLVSLSLVWL